MHRNDQGRRWLPALAYAGAVAAVMVAVGFSAMVQSNTQSTESLECDVLPVIRAADVDKGAAPERLKITVVGRRAPEVAGARSGAAQPARQPS